MVAAKIANLGHGGDHVTKSPIGDLLYGPAIAPVTQADAAALLNVGKRSVERAREVIDEGAPEMIAPVSESCGAFFGAGRSPEANRKAALTRGLLFTD